MAIGSYLVLLSVVFIITLLLQGSYFFYVERRAFLEITDAFEKIPMVYSSTISLVAFLITTFVVFYFSEDMVWFDQVHFFILSGLIVFAFALGFLNERGKVLQSIKLLGELACFGVVIISLPEGTRFIEYELPLDVDNALALLGGFTYFKMLQRLNRLDGYLVISSLALGATLLFGLLYSTGISVVFFQYMGILMPVMLAVLPFYLSRYPIPVPPSVSTALSFICSFAPLYMISQGIWGSALLLMAYPLFEMVIFIKGTLGFLIHKRKPLFFYEVLLERNIQPYFVVNYIFRRSVILSALALLSFYAKMQYQPLILGVLFMMDFYMRAISPATQKATIRGLFSDIIASAKKSIQETDQAVGILKERYSKKDESKENNKSENIENDKEKEKE